jgi:putative two-component system response regulator
MADSGEMRLLLVHADLAARESITRILALGGYPDVLGADDPSSTHQLCTTQRPDIVLLDLDGEGSELALEAIQPLTNPPESLPVLGLSTGTDPDARRRAVALGVRDFIALPVDETELLLRVGNLLEARRLRSALDDRNAMLAEAIRGRSSELDTARESLSVLAAIADYHDDDTSQHAERVGIGASLIARALGMPEASVAMIRDAAPLHDLGKVGMSRRILLKPGKLTPVEWMHMMRHVEIGAQILASARSPVLRLAAEIARTHHERFDGNGYVAGLAGDEIPLSGRITALADVWDTLTHERPYKAAWAEDRALAEITSEAGAHFDPRIVEAFLTIDRRELDDLPASDGAARAA